MTKSRIIPDIDPAEPLSAGLEKIVRARVHELVSFADGARKGGPEPVHDMRVACRRLLSVLKIFRGAVKSEGLRPLKRIFRALRDVRECDVFIKVLNKFEEKNTRTAAARLSGEYAKKRKSASIRLRKTIDSIDLRMLG